MPSWNLVPVGMIALAAAYACGPRSLATEAPPAVASDEPWVAEYLAEVERGCECKSSDCLQEAKQSLDGQLAAQGGLDEVPAEVHEGHGRFETCYRSGTLDPVRDHQLVADKMCECTTESCVKTAMIERVRLDDKYRDLDAADRDGIREQDAKLEKCRSEKTLDAEMIAAHYEKTAAAVCTCAQKKGCIGDRLHELGEVPTAPMVVRREVVQPRIDKALEEICLCAVNGALGTKVGGIQLTRSNCEALNKE